MTPPRSGGAVGPWSSSPASSNRVRLTTSLLHVPACEVCHAVPVAASHRFWELRHAPPRKRALATAPASRFGRARRDGRRPADAERVLAAAWPADAERECAARGQLSAGPRTSSRPGADAARAARPARPARSASAPVRRPARCAAPLLPAPLPGSLVLARSPLTAPDRAAPWHRSRHDATRSPRKRGGRAHGLSARAWFDASRAGGWRSARARARSAGHGARPTPHGASPAPARLVRVGAQRRRARDGARRAGARHGRAHGRRPARPAAGLRRPAGRGAVPRRARRRRWFALL